MRKSDALGSPTGREARSTVFAGAIILSSDVCFLSLRGAKRRSNPCYFRDNNGLLRCARNDGVDGPRTASMCQTGDVDSTRRREPSMGEISMIGLDLAKNVFQVHGVDASGAVVVRRQLRRGQVEKFFAQLPACTVGLEACGSAHHWARVIGRSGHQVRLMPPAYVKPYVKRNKNDGRDAEAICEAVNRPTMRFVPVKSVEQQATLAVHTARALLVRQRTMLANSLRAALSELGIVAAPGIKRLRELVVKMG